MTWQNGCIGHDLWIKIDALPVWPNVIQWKIKKKRLLKKFSYRKVKTGQLMMGSDRSKSNALPGQSNFDRSFSPTAGLMII